MGEKRSVVSDRANLEEEPLAADVRQSPKEQRGRRLSPDRLFVTVRVKATADIIAAAGGQALIAMASLIGSAMTKQGDGPWLTVDHRFRVASGLGQSQWTRAIRRLERDGYVVCLRAPGRKVRVRFTPKGRETVPANLAVRLDAYTTDAA